MAARVLLSPTMQRLVDLATLSPAQISPRARALARLSLLDWMTVARAGQEPLSRLIRDYIAQEGGRPVASLISHALDYDDTHFAHVGHLSVAILPAALATAEAVDATGEQLLHGFVVGAEAACRVGLMLGRGHYLKGWHQTATSGAFGAAMAAAVIRGLSPEQVVRALSLVATRASGLRCQFGTMGKPYNAGVAAANGVEAVELAARGSAQRAALLA